MCESYKVGDLVKIVPKNLGWLPKDESIYHYDYDLGIGLILKIKPYRHCFKYDVYFTKPWRGKKHIMTGLYHNQIRKIE